MLRRRSAVCLMLGTFAAPLAAQDAAPPRVDTPYGPAILQHVPEALRADSEWTLWVFEADANSTFADHRAYLEDLQERYREQGLRIGVLFPRGRAAAAVALAPKLMVGEHQPEQDGDGGAAVYFAANAMLSGRHGAPQFLGSGLDGLNDQLPAAFRGEELMDDATTALLGTALYGVGEGELPKESTDALVARLPHSGQAHALAVLQAWWCRADYAAARTALDTGCKALAGDALPMCLFADLVLRGDHFDPSVARRLAAEMGPVAALLDGPMTQLVYLRALLRAGQDRIAGRLVARLQGRLAGMPEHQVRFAETLMDAADPAPFRDLAERSLAAAEADDHDAAEVLRCRYKILRRCGDLEAAEKLLGAHREAGDAMSLNNDAWYAMTRLDTMGRFDSYALGQCEEMLRLEGDHMSGGNKDTVALALFLGGKVDEAVELQTAAAQSAGGDPRYTVRLNRFRAVQEMRAKAPTTAAPR